MFQFVLIIALCIPIMIESAGNWSYENQRQWVRGNRYCLGKSQSPINLQFDISKYDRRLKKLVLQETNSQKEQPELFNSGYTAQLNIKNRYVLNNVAPESEDYNVEQIHFHWGHLSNDINGSEHTHEGQSYPLEMHMVTYSNLYSNIRDAMTNTRSLAVVGAFFEISEEPNPFLQPLVNGLTHIRGQGQRTSINETFDLKGLFGEERMGRYYRYDGSLTTPPCFESVIWSVLLEPLNISSHQLHAFRSLHDNHTKAIANTYRKIQPLGTRKLFRSFHSKDLDEDLRQRAALNENNGKNLKNNMKLVLYGLISLLIIVF